ncbi:MAG: polyphenol oxidase family protein, partial [Sphingomonas bacterium]|nr:polyphenol oxidase family protein [Sphingomonas bacterium]
MTGVRSAALAAIPHGFFGHAAGDCGLGSGLDPALAAANRRAAADAILPGAPLASVYQVHSPNAVIVTQAMPDEQRPHADAIVTATRGLVLGIVTADCAPVLLADVEAGVIAAAHAGWRGAVAGVTDQAIAAMLTLGARVDRITAAVGPCIARASYEVDHAFAERLLADDPGNEPFLSDGPRGQPHFDLEAYVAARLAAAG